MQIKRLKLTNFRNYKELNIEFDEKTNIIYGNNAQGKTNILEALYLLATTKSHRKANDREMIRFEEKEATIHAVVDDGYGEFPIDIRLQRGKTKEIRVNRLPLSSNSELVGKMNVIVFSPEDLNIIKSSPSVRRNFMDIELCQMSPIYMQNLRVYKRIVEQRNKLLKDIAAKKQSEEMLDVWDLQMVSYGKEIIAEREKFLKRVGVIAEKLHTGITGNDRALEIEYRKSVSVDAFEKELAASREKDLRYQISHIGPHRDDIGFAIDGVDVQIYGSQGQQRTVALVLKLSEIDLIRTVYGRNPVLLLDDVLSELDRNRQGLLLKTVRENQTFITCTGLEEFVEHHFEMNRIFKVTDGSVERCNKEGV